MAENRDRAEKLPVGEGRFLLGAVIVVLLGYCGYVVHREGGCDTGRVTLAGSAESLPQRKVLDLSSAPSSSAVCACRSNRLRDFVSRPRSVGRSIDSVHTALTDLHQRSDRVSSIGARSARANGALCRPTPR